MRNRPVGGLGKKVQGKHACTNAKVCLATPNQKSGGGMVPCQHALWEGCACREPRREEKEHGCTDKLIWEVGIRTEPRTEGKTQFGREGREQWHAQQTI